MMNSLQKALVATVCAIGLVALTVGYFNARGPQKQTHVSTQIIREVAIGTDSASHFLNQRNELSKQLNLMKKAYGQQSCNIKKMEVKLGKQSDVRISENGGWCAEWSGSDSETHLFDKKFATAVSKKFKGKHMGSFGDGPGDYKKNIDAMKEVASYTAYDGAPFCEKTTEGRVKFLDLSAPQYGMPAFDWVISVEVGEHIPKQFEDIFLDNLARHAKEGVVLSWAVPEQQGTSHVNNQPLEHVVAQMEKRGFRIQKDESKELRESAEFPWLRNNVYIYRRVDQSSFEPEFA